MKIVRKYESGREMDLVKAIKEWVKQKGVKVKDIGKVTLTPAHDGIAISVYNKNGEFITNCLS